MFTVITDSFPELVARMGRLSLESSIRECVEIRNEWKRVNFGLELIAQAAADEATVNPWQVYQQKCAVAEKLISKVMGTPEFRNYLEVTKDLFGRRLGRLGDKPTV